MIVSFKHCPHMFHHECILEWLTKGHDECPICRASMVTESELVSAAKNIVDSKQLRKEQQRELNVLLAVRQDSRLESRPTNTR